MSPSTMMFTVNKTRTPFLHARIITNILHTRSMEISLQFLSLSRKVLIVKPVNPILGGFSFTAFLKYLYRFRSHKYFRGILLKTVISMHFELFLRGFEAYFVHSNRLKCFFYLPRLQRVFKHIFINVYKPFAVWDQKSVKIEKMTKIGLFCTVNFENC